MATLFFKVILKSVYYSKTLSCESDDQSRVNVNKAQVALRALACPVEPSISHVLIQITKCTQVGENSKIIFGRERYKEPQNAPLNLDI